MAQAPKAFTGRKRSRSTTWSVKLKDIVAQVMITLGGLGTIVAVLGVCFFLVWVVVPLFYPATVNDTRSFNVNVAPDQAPIAQGMDEYRLMSWMLDETGKLSAYQNADGKLLAQQAITEGRTITAAMQSDMGSQWVLGFSDGSIQRGQIGISSRLVDVTSLPSSYRSFTTNQIDEWKTQDELGLIQRVNDDQFRILTIVSVLQEPLRTADGDSVQLLDFTEAGQGLVVVMLTSKGKVFLDQIRERRNILTGKVTILKDEWELPFDVKSHGIPAYMLISGQGDALYMAWRDGKILRYDIRIPEEARLAEQLDLVPEAGEQLTSLSMLLGRGTLLAGDSLGQVRAWFRTRPEGATTHDGATLTLAHDLTKLDAAVVSIKSSSRSRIIAAGAANGHTQLLQVTSHKLLADLQGDVKAPVHGLTIAPKDDGLMILRGDKVYFHRIDVGHPETTLSSLFAPVWYENFNKPETSWQSTGGTDDFESKYGLWPLVFGSIKATVYCLLFGVPLALLGAVFTSEFLHPRTKAIVKPTIEMMASLPSVVLGFLAALVMAPVAEYVVPAILASFVTIPVAFLVGAFVWQLLPYEKTLRLGQWRLVFIAMFLPPGVIASYYVGPVMESVLFADYPMSVIASWFGGAAVSPGDLKAWLDGQMGQGAPGWMVILLPLCAISVAVAGARWINPILRARSGDYSRQQMALLSIFKFLVGSVVTLLLALVCGLILTNIFGWDPRGSVVGTYVQRNALVVGFVMGFAIIPIIYTIAEDALSAVPEHLRAASLGAGATPWQTAVRIVIPTAMSGLFSAIMIGVGRAVGETMIVLMAAGNTAVTEWNPFNGFRTLSANIAVELPEAVENSTHYRTLYMAALVLFVITFALNTIAETIRLRFRKRAFQL